MNELDRRVFAMKIKLILLVLLLLLSCTANIFASSKDCSTQQIVKYFFDITKVINEQNEILVPRLNSNNRVASFINNCSILKYKVYNDTLDRRKLPKYMYMDGYLTYKIVLTKEILDEVLSDLKLVILKKNISSPSNSSKDSLNRQIESELKKLLIKKSKAVRPCGFSGFYTTFINIKIKSANKNIEPPLPSYDGSSSVVSSINTDLKTVNRFVKDCPIIYSNTLMLGHENIVLSNRKLMEILQKLKKISASEKLEGFGYLGGNWKAGDYYISSENELEVLVQARFLGIVDKLKR